MRSTPFLNEPNQAQTYLNLKKEYWIDHDKYKRIHFILIQIKLKGRCRLHTTSVTNLKFQDCSCNKAMEQQPIHTPNPDQIRNEPDIEHFRRIHDSQLTYEPSNAGNGSVAPSLKPATVFLFVIFVVFGLFIAIFRRLMR